ncbi:hypothetical protein HPP92_003495 [Vanilla planifolia]|uniref:Uncharacterized protein n=1 Tax=Vanilla planifolia TaxID=51239 RepID=A0A835VFI3_VANPL|nr:hypothetical protein HPP92_003495 [Vanilla planifolia]
MRPCSLLVLLLKAPKKKRHLESSRKTRRRGTIYFLPLADCIHSTQERQSLTSLRIVIGFSSLIHMDM